MGRGGTQRGLTYITTDRAWLKTIGRVEALLVFKPSSLWRGSVPSSGDSTGLSNHRCPVSTYKTRYPPEYTSREEGKREIRQQFLHSQSRSTPLPPILTVPCPHTPVRVISLSRLLSRYTVSGGHCSGLLLLRKYILSCRKAKKE